MTTDKKPIMPRIAGKPLSAFTIFPPKRGGECLTYAASEFQHYIKAAFGFTMGMDCTRKSGRIVLCAVNEGIKDSFTVKVKKGELYLAGVGERGVLYAVYSFLEKFVGWRFFSGEMCFRGQENGSFMAPCEKLFPQQRTELGEGEEYSESPTILFRDIFGHATVREDWCAKNRLNGDIWKLRNTPDHLGGADSFATDGGHSFSRLLPEEEYFEKHPEYFSLLDGKRVPGPGSQLCLTADGLAEALAKSVKKILRESPEAHYVSVSQNDNNNFCTCEKCRKKEAEIGRGNVLFELVNRVAELIESEFPKVKIHTYAYESTIQDDMIKLNDNILLQYCLNYCHSHSLEDGTCAANRAVADRLRHIASCCKQMFIYDYRSCEGKTFMMLPDLFRFRDNMRFLADIGVTGIYAETDIFCLNSPTMEELRNYVTAKLMWNPYMSEEEFNRHIDEFLEGYYGKGWKHIRRYLKIWEEESANKHFYSIHCHMLGDDGEFLTENGKRLSCDILDRDKLCEVCARLENELDCAYEMANSEEKPRVDILRTVPLWYRLYHTMDEIMENGTDEEKEAVVRDNRMLCSLMRLYCMKYTSFIAMTETTEMYKDFTLSPSKWKYWGHERKM